MDSVTCSTMSHDPLMLLPTAHYLSTRSPQTRRPIDVAAEEVRIESVIPLAASFVARGHAAHVERLIALSSGGTPAIL
jgi:hypothetical protein